MSKERQQVAGGGGLSEGRMNTIFKNIAKQNK